MAVIVPTVEEIVARFPAFEGQEVLLTACLAEAVTQVDDRWREADTKFAIMYLTAHLAQVEIDGGADSGVAGNIASESMGPISVSYRDGSTTSADDYSGTVYGKRFEALLRQNFAGAMVAGIENT